MQYTAIIKDGGLFIPNVFSDLNDGNGGVSHIVQVEVDIAEVRQQLSANAALTTEAPKTQTPKKEVPKQPKKQVKKQDQKEAQKALEDVDLDTQSKSAIDELEGLDDSELSEIFKVYMNDGQVPTQISLENF